MAKKIDLAAIATPRKITAPSSGFGSESELVMADIPETTETDEEIKARIAQRFIILERMTNGVKRGQFKSMIVSGAAGVGKTHTIEEALSPYKFVSELGSSELTFEIVGGKTSALGLYQTLYHHRHSKHVVVFDDCNSVLYDSDSLEILKRALDSKERRTINWNLESRVLQREGIENSFEFNGGVIFVTNINFDYIRGGRRAEDLKALVSRSHYMDLTIHTQREKMLRIHQVVEQGMLDKHGFEDYEVKEILDFIEENKQFARDMSVRLVGKIAEIRASMPDMWKEVAIATCTRKQ